MKHVSKLMLLVGLILFLSTSNLYATANNQYVPGIEGLRAGSVPPPGFYFRMYNVFYTSDELMDKNGDEIPIDFEVDVVAIANRFIWVTDKKLLGANLFINGTIPLISTDIKIGALGVDDDEFGLGDVNFEPVGLAWHGPRYDAALAVGLWMPLGDYDADEPASPGKGCTTYMTTFGGTLYLDAARTLTIAALGRYEIHTEKNESNLTPGHDLTIEWSIGKSFAKVWEAGLVGYGHWQLTDDSGSDAVDPGTHDHVYGIGGEISVFVPSVKTFFNLRAITEFDAEDRSEGDVFCLMITKIF